MVVFRGLRIGIFLDWWASSHAKFLAADLVPLRLDCADYVVGIKGAIFNTYDNLDDARGTYDAAGAEGFLRVIEP